VVIGESVFVDHTTPDPTIVAVSKEWLSIEDILRALKRLPEPLMHMSETEWDQTICFCIDDPSEYYMLGPDLISGHWTAVDIIEADGNALGYMRRWGVRYPPQDASYPYLPTWGTHVPAYFWGDATRPTHWNCDDAYMCYGTYFENIYFDHWEEDEGTYINNGVQQVGWSYGDAWTGNPIRSPWNDYLMLPDQLFNGYIYRNCKFNHGCAEYLPYGDEDPLWNHACIYPSLWSLYDDRTSDDISIFEQCQFKARDSHWPRLVKWWGDEDRWDGYVTHMYLYDCIVDVLGNPIQGGDDYDGYPDIDDIEAVLVHSTNTKWIGVPDILSDINHYEIMDINDRAALSHVHDSSGSSGGSDPYAIHDNVIGEINMVDEKTSPVGADLILIEDSEASYAKKKMQITNVPAVGTDRFFLSGTITSGSPKGGAWVAPGYGEVENVYMHMADSGTSGSTDVDVNKNGSSVFSGTKLLLAYDDADKVTSKVPDTGTFSPGDIFTIDVDSVAGGTPSDLTIIIAFNLLL
jgi:hypothetical protein